MRSDARRSTIEDCPAAVMHPGAGQRMVKLDHTEGFAVYCASDAPRDGRIPTRSAWNRAIRGGWCPLSGAAALWGGKRLSRSPDAWIQVGRPALGRYHRKAALGYIAKGDGRPHGRHGDVCPTFDRCHTPSSCWARPARTDRRSRLRPQQSAANRTLPPYRWYARSRDRSGHSPLRV